MGCFNNLQWLTLAICIQRSSEMNQREKTKLGVKVRCVQQRCRLSNKQAECVASLLADYVGKPDLCAADRELDGLCGVHKVVLHGCTGCNDYVYGPDNNLDNCVKCGASRYKPNSRHAKEMVYYFPIRPRLQALLQLPNFLRLLQVCNNNVANVIFTKHTNCLHSHFLITV